MANPYKRVVLKLSGESFAAAGERGIAMDEVVLIANQVKKASDGCQIAVVIGGGNILRGGQFVGTSASIQEATAHYMGCLLYTSPSPRDQRGTRMPSSA